MNTSVIRLRVIRLWAKTILMYHSVDSYSITETLPGTSDVWNVHKILFVDLCLNAMYQQLKNHFDNFGFIILVQALLIRNCIPKWTSSAVKLKLEYYVI